jgi:Phospholipase_D-nuclease N-terminal
MLASSYPLLDVFISMIWFFVFVLWIWLLISIVFDIFRSHDMGGLAKALWLLFILVLPFLGVLIYLIVRGGNMHERSVARARSQEEALRTYVPRPPVEAPLPASWRLWPSSTIPAS